MTPPEEESKRMGSPEERRQNSVSDFPPPAGREFILRTTVPRPAPYSKALPQRMYSVLTKEDFRLAGAFSSDTSFFWFLEHYSLVASVTVLPPPAWGKVPGRTWEVLESALSIWVIRNQTSIRKTSQHQAWALLFHGGGSENGLELLRDFRARDGLCIWGETQTHPTLPVLTLAGWCSSPSLLWGPLG